MTLEQALRGPIEAYRRMTPQQRLQVSFRLYGLTRTLARQGVKHQHPNWNARRVEEEVTRRFCLAAGIPESLRLAWKQRGATSTAPGPTTVEPHSASGEAR